MQDNFPLHTTDVATVVFACSCALLRSQERAMWFQHVQHVPLGEPVAHHLRAT